MLAEAFQTHGIDHRIPLFDTRPVRNVGPGTRPRLKQYERILASVETGGVELQLGGDTFRDGAQAHSLGDSDHLFTDIVAREESEERIRCVL